MQMIEVNKLTPHPRNSEFFDDITGDKWEDFKKSVVRRGVVEGVVVTQDLVIVSGHQRVRACKELGVTAVPCRVTHYHENDPQTGNPKEDMILEDLISTNILQRGIGNVNPMKMARCIVELERIYGIKQGRGGNVANMNNSYCKSQKDLANDIGIDQTQLNNYKRLNNLIPEFQEMVDEGSLKATTAYKLWAKMPKEEQEKLFNEIGKEQITQMTQKQTQEYLHLQNEVDSLKQKLQQEKSRQTETITVEKEVIPDHLVKEVNEWKKKVNLKEQELSRLNNLISKLNSEKQMLDDAKRQLEQKFNSDEHKVRELKLKEDKLKHEAHVSIFEMQIKIQKFIQDAASSVFLQGAVTYGDRLVRKELIESVRALEDFTDKLKEILGYEKENKKYIIDAEVVE